MSGPHPLVFGNTRNLTYTFRRHRDEARRTYPPPTQDLETAALLNSALGGSGHDVEMATSTLLSPVWIQQSERIREELSMLKERLTKLKEAHSRALLVSFGDTGSEAVAQAEALTRELQRGFKRVNMEIGNMEQPTPGADDADVRKQVRQQLARALMALTQEFRREETRFLNKVEAQKGLTAGSSIGLVDSDSSSALDTLDPGFTSKQALAVNASVVQAEERDKEIQNIVDTITELAQIMRDLGALVVEQGTLLDRIDHSIQDTAMNIEQGLVQLRKADRAQQSTRGFLCMITLGVMVVVMLIVIIAKVALRAGLGLG